MSGGDDHHLAFRYRQAAELEAQQAKILARETRRASNAGLDVSRSARPTRDPVDAVRLRGIPCVGPGSAGGAMRGSRPDTLEWLDERHRRQRRRL